MQVITIPPVDPALVRLREGYAATGTWVSPIHQRPYGLKLLQNNPGSDVAEDRS